MKLLVKRHVKNINIANLIVKLRELKHPIYKRVNINDLICTQKLTLVQALNSEPIRITTLDDRKLTITMDEIISPQTIKVVKNEGMPIFDKANPLNNVLFKEKKGDLYIKFEIYFPKFIDPEKKEEIIRLLEDK
jgi:DnaJ family protein B protein 4